jgi:hypothetical protein
LGGEISRIDLDLDSEGYRGILLGNRPSGWKQQSRFPLIQRALSSRLQRSEQQISIGFQNIDGSQLETITYPHRRLDEAEEEAQELAKILSSEWSHQKVRL